MSEPKTNNVKFVVPDPSPDDDIYIDCQPVNEKKVVTNDSYSGDGLNSSISAEVLYDISKQEFDIFDNIGFQSLLAVGIFAVILVSGNYVFNTIPNSRLQKAIDKERFS